VDLQGIKRVRSIDEEEGRGLAGRNRKIMALSLEEPGIKE
jgi:hypothetical protein